MPWALLIIFLSPALAECNSEDTPEGNWNNSCRQHLWQTYRPKISGYFTHYQTAVAPDIYKSGWKYIIFYYTRLHIFFQKLRTRYSTCITLSCSKYVPTHYTISSQHFKLASRAISYKSLLTVLDLNKIERAVWKSRTRLISVGAIHILRFPPAHTHRAVTGMAALTTVSKLLPSSCNKPDSWTHITRTYESNNSRARKG